jgi:hypothetical protein
VIWVRSSTDTVGSAILVGVRLRSTSMVDAIASMCFFSPAKMTIEPFSSISVRMGPSRLLHGFTEPALMRT